MDSAFLLKTSAAAALSAGLVYFLPRRGWCILLAILLAPLSIIVYSIAGPSGWMPGLSEFALVFAVLPALLGSLFGASLVWMLRSILR